jgi:Asp-tRNA(Asn)/Glu-tRNA(Gln) amidotransferase A subunit family amidase
MPIKGNVDIAGLKASLTSRAWEEPYIPTQEGDSSRNHQLLELGAAVVGKSKLSQFAEVENPTADWIDLHCPFDPRGDSYLNPEGSTSG